ncbi:MAG: FG-GAP-like repeat-containing protein, partial [Blastocatellia bacterium]
MHRLKTRLAFASKIGPIVICAFLTLSLTLIPVSAMRSPALRSANQAHKPVSDEAKEAAYKANNIGVALLEQFKYEEGVPQFKRALQLDPGLAIAHLNLAVALFNEPNVAGAVPEAKLAAQLLQDKPRPFYMLGLIARSQNRIEDAIAAFKRVLELDPADVGTCINLGQLYSGQTKYADAVELLRKALATEPYNITASYNLAIALLRSGKREEGQQMMVRFQKLRESGYGTTIDQHYLSQGRYSEAVPSTGAEPDLVDPATPKVTFTDATQNVVPSSGGTHGQTSPGQVQSIFGRQMKASELTPAAKQDIAASFAGGVVLFDFDGDGDLDMFVVTAHQQKLYRNDCGKFVDVTQQAGLGDVPAGSIGIGAIAGDYDNDEKPDLFVLRYGGFSLYHNDGNGKFTETTKSAGISSYPYLALSAAFVDVDHDGDLDIFIGGFADLTPPPGDADRSLTFPDDFRGAPNLLLRNDGNGKFTDITAAAKVGGTGGHALAIVPTDYDNHRDIDLFVLNYGSAPTLFSNQRDGSFNDVAADSGLSVSGKFTSVAAADFNKDGYTDFFLGKADGSGLLAVSDRRLHFATQTAPPGTEGATAAQFIDYDNDGLLDLATVSSSGIHIARNLGSKWVDVSDT